MESESPLLELSAGSLTRFVLPYFLIPEYWPDQGSTKAREFAQP